LGLESVKRRWWVFTARKQSANSRTGQHDADDSFSGGASPVGFGV